MLLFLWGFLVDDRGVQNVAHLVNGIKNLSVLFFARLKYLGVCEGTRVQLQTFFTMFWALTKIIDDHMTFTFFLFWQHELLYELSLFLFKQLL